ncbi:hypothetical protein EV182_001881 [Spiromyces aspiralis]|uniref:Uncharacterized protein n=1 Tax=Spiromyces aspiralis TaxID=68401 RepID=A0ACC1HYM9_9FUNG|nr:hypothetical protein EV182_001881 [Spiromyces aspiralis]
MAGKPIVYVIYYSLYGHIRTLAYEVMKGLEASGKVEAKLFQVQETIPPETLERIHAAPKDPNVPVIEPAQMVEADAFMFGIPTRYGNTVAQMRQFWDLTGKLWASAALRDKMAALFFSTGSPHGGQETTALTFLSTLAHHGMIYVPYGYAHPAMSRYDKVIGGSAWGAGTIAGGDGSRQPSPEELEIALDHGNHFAEIVARFNSHKE